MLQMLDKWAKVGFCPFLENGPSNLRINYIFGFLRSNHIGKTY
jgi:hypothetical protein